MPLLLIGTGLILILTGVIGDGGKLWELFSSEFSGPGNFLYWLVAIIVLGALGYVKAFGNLSRLFIVLVLLVILLKKDSGFFDRLQQFIQSTSSKSTTTSGGPSNG